MKFIHLLQKPASQRTKEDVNALYSFLCSHKALCSFSEVELKNVCCTVKYEKHSANSLVFRRQELITCWYVLLSGSVFIDGRMYIADDSFGKRNSGELYRTNDCIVSETSELMVIDYVGGSKMDINQSDRLSNDGSTQLSYLHSQNRHFRYSDSSLFDQNFEGEVMRSGVLRQSGVYVDPFCLGSMASDTSSLCSGSDVMLSSTEDQPIDLTGLIESIVDSEDDDDEDDDYNYIGRAEEECLSMHDAFRDCLEKTPEDRTEKDVEIILENIQHLPAFNNMTLATRQALCGVMRYAAIDAMDTVVMTDGEQLDSWSVILNGEVETVHPDGTVKVLKQGESFGLVAPTTDKIYHQGIMHTRVNNCQFLCITQDDYCRVMQQGEENIQSIKENNSVVLVTEERVVDDNRKARVVIRVSCKFKYFDCTTVSTVQTLICIASLDGLLEPSGDISEIVLVAEEVVELKQDYSKFSVVIKR